MKNESIRIDTAQQREESNYWRFRHENFIRGRPDLLKDIKKTSHQAAEKAEVDALKKEVHELRARLSSMSNDVTRLTSLVETLMMQNGNNISSIAASAGASARDNPPTKRRRLSSNGLAASSINNNAESRSRSTTPTPLEQYQPGTIKPLAPRDRQRSISLASLGSLDQAIADGILNDYLVDLDDIMNAENGHQAQELGAAVPDGTLSADQHQQDVALAQELGVAVPMMQNGNNISSIAASAGASARDNPPTKRRRLSSNGLAASSINNNAESRSRSTTPTPLEQYQPGTIKPLAPRDRQRSISLASLGSLDQAIADGILNDYLVDLDDIMNAENGHQAQELGAAVPDGTLSADQHQQDVALAQELGVAVPDEVISQIEPVPINVDGTTPTSVVGV